MGDLAKTEKRSLLVELADQAGLEPARFYDAVKEQCGCRGATDGHFMALLMQAREYGLNPIMREMWLFPGQGNIRPTISHDGWFKILTRHPRYVHHVYREGEDEDGRYGEVDIWTRESVDAGLPPYQHREYLSEVRKGPTWKTHPKRMLRGRTISQGARHCFGISGMDVTEAAWDEPDEPRTVPADIAPAVEIEALGGDGGVGDESGALPDADAASSPAPTEDFDAEESARLDAEIAESEGLFDE